MLTERPLPVLLNLSLLKRKSALTCPDCGVYMTPYTCQSAVVDRCPRCGGIWFDAGELAVFKQNLEGIDLSEIEVVPPEREKGLRISGCPRCETTLEGFPYLKSKRIKLYRCGTCQGTWSPLPELLQLVARVKSSQQLADHVKVIHREFSELERQRRRWEKWGEVGDALNEHVPAWRLFLPRIILPLADDAPRETIPWVTFLLLVLNGYCFFMLPWDPESASQVIRYFGMVPFDVMSGQKLYTLLTSPFIHIGFFHLLFNLYFLWLFGDNVEDHLGKARYLGLFLVGAVAAAMGQAVVHPGSLTPYIGASGAISSLMGMYFYLFPTAMVRTYALGVLISLPAIGYLVAWFVFQAVWNGFHPPMGAGSLAWYSNLTGFAWGFVSLYVLERTGRLVSPRALSLDG